MDENKIIKSLIKIIGNQNTILEKLAQQQSVEAYIDYLKRAWTTAGINTGVSPISTPHIEYTPPNKSGNNTEIGEMYTLYVGELKIADDMKNKLLNNFRSQVKLQKPELVGKVSVIFGNK